MSSTDQWNPWSLNGSYLASNIIITGRCADSASHWLRMPARDVRNWLRKRLADDGYVSRIPPPSMQWLKSRSEYYATVDNIFVLALKTDRDGTDRPVATHCYFFPDWLIGQGYREPVPDPFTLRGPRLVEQVEFTRHSIRQFQERCNGHPDPSIAEQQLRLAISRTAHAADHHPPWGQSLQHPDFYLVTDDGYCLPMRNYGDTKSFVALTCLHQSMNPQEAVGKPQPPPAVTVRCGSCRHEATLLRAQLEVLPEPRCANCHRKIGIRLPVRCGRCEQVTRLFLSQMATQPGPRCGNCSNEMRIRLRKEG